MLAAATRCVEQIPIQTRSRSRALKRGNLWHFIGKLVCDFYDKISVKLCVDAREVYDR